MRESIMKKTSLFFVCSLVALSLTGCASLEQTQLNEKAVKPDMLVLIENANQAYTNKNWVEAEQVYREIIKTMNRDEFSYFRLGNTLLRQGRLDEAEDELLYAIELNPQFLEARHNLSTVYILKAEKQVQTMKKSVSGDQRQAIERKAEWLRKAASESLQ